MSFDFLAPHYRWMEWVLAGERLQRCRTAWLDVLPSPDRVLIFGEGNGRFLEALMRRFPSCEVVCVDASARMAELARARIQAGGLDGRRVRFVVSDLLEWKPGDASFDLIVCHFILDCFRPDQLDRVGSLLAAVSRPGARLLLGDFSEPRRGWRRWRARIILWSMYRFFRSVTRLPASFLTPPDPILQRQGFQLLKHQTSEWGLLRSDIWSRVAPVRSDVGPGCPS